MGRARQRQCARRDRGRRPGCESLERREVPTISFGTVVGLGASGQSADFKANAEALDASGDVVVVGSLMQTANFNPNGTASNLTSAGNRDAYVAEYSPGGVLNWLTAFPGQSASSVGQVSAVAVDSSGNIEVAGSFSGTVRFGSTTLSAPSRTDSFVAKLNASGAVLWAVQTTGATNKVDSAKALAPDGSGGVYIAGSYMGSMTLGSSALTAAGSFEAFAAHLDSTGRFTWASSTAGSSGSVAGMNGLAVDASGRLVMAGYYAGTVDFDPGAGVTSLTSAGSYDIATWVLNADGSLAWARGFGGTNYDQADAVATDASGNVYVTGAFSGMVNFAPSGTAINLTATGIYDVFVLKLSPTGSTAWAGSFAGSNGPAMGDGLAVDSTGRVIVDGWFVGTVDFDPGVGTATVASQGAEDAFVAVLDSSGNYLAATTGGGAGSDMAFGLALNASGKIAIAGTYTGPTTSPPSGPTTFGPTSLPTIGQADVFVATLTQSGGSVSIGAPSAPVLEASSDSGTSSSDGMTNVTSPTFDVMIATSGLTVQLLRDGTVVATRVGPGAITDPGPLTDGVHQYTARQSDGQGSTGPLSATTQVTIDTTPPAAAPAPALATVDDSGTVGDGLTNVNRPHLVGTAEAGATVTLSIGGSLVGIGTASGGSYSILLGAALAEGTYTVTATAIDAAGNVGAAGAPFTFTVDTTPPAAPPAPALLAVVDSGTVGDGITSVTKPRLTGTAEPGSTVRLYIGGSVVGTGVATGGSCTIQLNATLSDGVYAVTARATDAAGNVGAAGSAFSLTIDTTPPAAPPAPGLLAADDSGTVGDGITSVNRPRLMGAAEAGSTVRLFTGGTLIGTGTATGGTYTILLNVSLADGTYSVTATATDAAGNVGAAGAAFALRIDTTPPAAPPAPALLAADDSGTVGDGITNVNRPHLLGTAESGSTVRLYIGGSVVGTGVASGGSYSILLTSALADGTYSVTATAADAAGNTSAAGGAFALTIDTTPPTAPSAPSLLAADDSGTVGDGITNINRPRLTGSAEPGSTVRLFIAGSVVGTGVATGGSYTILLSSTFADGTYSITAAATDAGGNVSGSSVSLALTIDTTAPAAPSAPSLLAGDDSGVVGDGITNVGRPHLLGTAESGSTVRLYIAGSLVGTGTATGGAYAIQLTSALADGTYAVTATAIDAAGNVGAAGPAFSLTIDTTAPAAPPAPALLAADDSGTAGDGITNVSKPHLVGSAEAGATVKLSIAGVVVGTGVASGGSYSILLTSALADGTYSVTATATDAAGNTGAAGAAFALTIDTTAPSRPPAPGLLAGDDSGVVGDGITNISMPHLTGTAEAGATVKLFIGGAIVGTETATGGTYTILLNKALADGTYSVTATATDAAGNLGVAGVAFALTIDTTAPAAPPAPGLLAADDSGVQGDGITRVTQPRLTGSAEPGSTVRLSIGGTIVGVGTATGGIYTIPLTSALADGTYSVTATATDAAGNLGAVGTPFALTIDTAPPAAPPAPALLAADDSGTVGDGITIVSKPRLTGSAEPGATVTLWIVGVAVGTGSAAGGSYTILLNAPLAAGSYTITATATDAAGNVGPAGAAFALTILSAPPAAPTSPALLAADDSGAVGDGITNVSKPRLTGSAAANTTVQLYINGALIAAGPATGGTYTLLPFAALADGTYSVTATATDASGLTSAPSAAFTLTIDTAVPAAPSLALLAVDDTGVKGDGVTEVHQPRLSGVAQPGAVVQLLDASGKVVASAVAAAQGGSYTITAPYALAGSFTYRTRVVDAAGNVGPAGASTTFRILGVAGDYDGDGKADIITYDATTTVWTILSSATGATTHVTFGIAGTSVAVPADYDGDGKTDLAVYNPPTGAWYIFNSATKTVTHYVFGSPGDIPVPADYTGEGRAEPALYRPSTSQWIVFDPVTAKGYLWTFGFANASLPEPAPYAGYGTADLGIYQPSTGNWYSVNTVNWALAQSKLGQAGDAPVPADYDGDGKADIAVYRASTSQWYIAQSSAATTRVVTYGAPGLVEPVPLDYSGDARVDLAIYLPTASQFAILSSANGSQQFPFVGVPGLDSAAQVPWSYLYASVVRITTAAAPAARPALAASPVGTSTTSSPPPSAAPALAARPEPTPVINRGLPVPQSLVSKRWSYSPFAGI